MPLDRRLDTVQVVPPTPFSPDGKRVLVEPLTALVRDLFDAGVRAFLPAAGTGEFHSLSADEVLTCVRATRSAVPPDGVVIAPLGFSLDHALAIGSRALEAGADALLLMPSIHPYLSDAGFRDYFLALTEALGVPLLAYKRGPVPSDGLLLELARAGKLLGVKYAVNDADQFLRFATAARGLTGLYCGTAERWAPFFMLAGATGYTSGIGTLCPRLTLALHADLSRGDYGTAFQRLTILRPLEEFRSREADSFNIVAVKEALNLCGRGFGPCRPPQRRLNEAERGEIQELLGPLLAAERTLKESQS
jgi:4-hydroxy-tetrahydrodipicolinate synthase